MLLPIGGPWFILLDPGLYDVPEAFNEKLGVKESDEPLNTLKNYRTGDSSKPIFGQNLVHTKVI